MTGGNATGDQLAALREVSELTGLPIGGADLAAAGDLARLRGQTETLATLCAQTLLLALRGVPVPGGGLGHLSAALLTPDLTQAAPHWAAWLAWRGEPGQWAVRERVHLAGRLAATLLDGEPRLMSLSTFKTEPLLTLPPQPGPPNLAQLGLARAYAQLLTPMQWQGLDLRAHRTWIQEGVWQRAASGTVPHLLHAGDWQANPGRDLTGHLILTWDALIASPHVRGPSRPGAGGWRLSGGRPAPVWGQPRTRGLAYLAHVPVFPDAEALSAASAQLYHAGGAALIGAPARGEPGCPFTRVVSGAGHGAETRAQVLTHLLEAGAAHPALREPARVAAIHFTDAVPDAARDLKLSPAARTLWRSL